MPVGDPSDDGGSKHLWNVRQLIRDYTAQYPQKLSFSAELDICSTAVNAFSVPQTDIFKIISVTADGAPSMTGK
jgi:hypothetical protein